MTLAYIIRIIKNSIKLMKSDETRNFDKFGLAGTIAVFTSMLGEKMKELSEDINGKSSIMDNKHEEMERLIRGAFRSGNVELVVDAFKKALDASDAHIQTIYNLKKDLRRLHSLRAEVRDLESKVLKI